MADGDGGVVVLVVSRGVLAAINLAVVCLLIVSGAVSRALPGLLRGLF